MNSGLLRNSTTKLAIVGAVLVILAGVSAGVNPAVLIGLLAMLPITLLWLWLARTQPMVPSEGLYGLDTNAGCWALQMALPALSMVLIAMHVRLTGQPPYLWSVLAGVALLGIVLQIGGAGPRAIAPAVAVFVVSAIYAGGALVGLNAAFDHSSNMRLTSMTVTGMDAAINRYGSSYSVTATGQTGPRGYKVPGSLYGRLKVGGSICLAERPGALGMPWTDILACNSGE